MQEHSLGISPAGTASLEDSKKSVFFFYANNVFSVYMYIHVLVNNLVYILEKVTGISLHCLFCFTFTHLLLPQPGEPCRIQHIIQNQSYSLTVLALACSYIHACMCEQRCYILFKEDGTGNTCTCTCMCMHHTISPATWSE